MAETNPTLYEQIGGEVAVNAAVDIFYRRVLNDYRINRFFDNVDMEQQASKLVDLIHGERTDLDATKPQHFPDKA